LLLCHKPYDMLSFATLVGQAQCLVHTLYATFPNNFDENSILILLHHPTPRHPDIPLTPKFTCTFLYSIFAYPIQKYVSSHRSRGVRWAVRFVTHSAVETHSTVIDCTKFSVPKLSQNSAVGIKLALDVVSASGGRTVGGKHIMMGWFRVSFDRRVAAVALRWSRNRSISGTDDSTSSAFVGDVRKPPVIRFWTGAGTFTCALDPFHQTVLPKVMIGRMPQM